MKNWKAAFNSQWQTIKFQEDEKKLIQCLRKEESDKKNDISEKGEIMDKTVIYLNYILSQYQRHPTWIDNSQLIPIYDHLKAEKAIKLNSDEVEICKQMGPEKGKAQAVKFLFDRMIKENRRFI